MFTISQFFQSAQEKLPAKFTLLIIFALVIFPQVPLIPMAYPEFWLDAGMIAGLNMAATQHLRFGRDIIFTYGPLGYMCFPTFPEADPELVRIFTLSCYVLTVYAAWRLLSQEGVTSLSGVALIATACALFFLDFSIWNRNVFRIEVIGFLLVINILLAFRAGRGGQVDLFLLAIVSGVAALVKFSMACCLISLTACLAVFCSFDTNGIDRKALLRNLALLSLIPGSMLVLFYCNQGSVVYFGNYLRGAWQLIVGYAEAVSVPVHTAALVNVAGAMLILLVLTRGLWREWRRSIDALAAAAVVTAFAYKNFVVRQDGWHMTTTFFELAMAAIMIMTRIDNRRYRSLVTIVSLAFVGSGIAVVVNVAKLDSSHVLESVTNLPMRMTSYIRFEKTASELVKRQQEYIRAYRLTDSVLHRIGKYTVDIFPNDILIAKANNLVWNPRPIFQSYGAYTPYLDNINATHIEQNGPDMALIQWSLFDDRLPFVDEPLTWEALLNYYDFLYQTPKFVLVRRRIQAKFVGESAMTESEVDWGKPVRVPAARPGEYVSMKAVILPTLAGRLSNFLFRSSSIRARLTVSDDTIEGRVIRANLASGVIVSPLATAQTDIAEIFDCWSEPRKNIVKDIRFDTSTQWQYQKKIRIHWQRLQCAPPAPQRNP